MPQLVVYRPKAFALKLNAAAFELDGSPVGELKNNSRLEVAIAPGAHRIVQSWKKSLLGKWIKDRLECEFVASEPVTYVRLGTGAEYGLGEVTVLWQVDVVDPATALQELAAIPQ